MDQNRYSAMAAEAQFLREELVANKKFVFERPLVIVGALFLADRVVAVGSLTIVLGVLALTYNLWFTANRLRSNARIIAYLQLVHESAVPGRWVGWETALRLYRFYRSEQRPSRTEAWAPDPSASEADSLRFYGGMFTLHVIVIAVFWILLVSRLGVLQPIVDVLDADATRIATAVLLLVIAGGVLLQLRPGSERTRSKIERQHWLGVIETYLPPPADVPGSAHDEP